MTAAPTISDFPPHTGAPAMTHTQTQGADGAGTKAAGEVAHGAFCAFSERWFDLTPNERGMWDRVAAAVIAHASPAPAATPGVPDSLRALSESELRAADAWLENKRKYEHSRVAQTAIDTARAAISALIAAQPAGQAGDAGAEDRGKCIGCGKALTAEEAEFLVNTCDACEREEHESRQNAEEPAPNSTRTGAAETIPVPAELVSKARSLAWSVKGDAYLGNEAETELAQEVDRALLAAERDALAARPEAPSDAGWNREDLEAFVAREWPEGRSAGAAARELVRALGVRGLAPTLQRLLTDLLGQINFASTDRAQILADFANAAPEAARMAKIDSFERWNPRVFDPTPPSDPAPSGQAEG